MKPYGLSVPMELPTLEVLTLAELGDENVRGILLVLFSQLCSSLLLFSPLFSSSVVVVYPSLCPHLPLLPSPPFSSSHEYFFSPLSSAHQSLLLFCVPFT